MSDMRTAKNYHAHGGSEWVVGGKLTFLPGATVEGLDGLLDKLPSAELLDQKLPYVADSDSGTVAALREDLNHLLSVLRTAGYLSAESGATEPAE